MKALLSFLGMWLGRSVFFTILSLLMSGFVVLHMAGLRQSLPGKRVGRFLFFLGHDRLDISVIQQEGV